jgi:hypothetical protein
MKEVLSIALFTLLISFNGFTQSTSNVQLFGQCMFNIESVDDLNQLTEEMKLNPAIEMVRLDFNTQRALIITKNLQTLTESDFISWFGVYSNTIYCTQIGVYGVDELEKFPFVNCQN